jgi:GR25 family glycosyltransferase involved in LPS biosynthesis
MKSFVITIKSNPKSVAVAERCIKSMPGHNVKMFDAFTPKDDPQKLFKEKGLPTKKFIEKFSYFESGLSAFLSHYTLWEKCVEDNVEYQIFEHDAVAINNLPLHINYDKIISLGQPSYGKYNTPMFIGVGPLTSKPYFPGAHAYRLKPDGAKLLIETAKEMAGPTDIFLRRQLFPFLQEFYPWPVMANDSFTTLQKEAGCLAKHNWKGGRNYEILQ